MSQIERFLSKNLREIKEQSGELSDFEKIVIKNTLYDAVMKYCFENNIDFEKALDDKEIIEKCYMSL